MEGIFGISSSQDCLENLFDGTFCLQHRGQEYCGLSTSDGKIVKIRTHRGLVGPSFTDDLPGLEGCWGIGVTSSQDRQPVSRHSKRGEFTIGMNGYLLNSSKLRTRLLKKGYSFATLEDVELVAGLIDQGRNITEGIKETLTRIQGPCNLVLLTKEGVYAARDVFGFRPLVLGRGEGKCAVASESCAFDINTKLERIRDVEPGEIVFLSREGALETTKLGNSKRKYCNCSFEWVYFARPDSIIEGIPVAKVRHNLGRFLAQNDNVEADVVGAVPFSGILHAEGYHLESHLPSVEVFLLPQYLKRTYIMPLRARKKEKEIKLRPLKENVAGKRIVLGDDSIRSGITMRGLVALLKGAGAKEVHVRIASPPSIRYCPHERPAEEEEEFIASKMSVEEISRFIEADSLVFQKLEDVPRAIGLPPENLCLDCFL